MLPIDVRRQVLKILCPHVSEDDGNTLFQCVASLPDFPDTTATDAFHVFSPPCGRCVRCQSHLVRYNNPVEVLSFVFSLYIWHIYSLFLIRYRSLNTILEERLFVDKLVFLFIDVIRGFHLVVSLRPSTSFMTCIPVRKMTLYSRELGYNY